ncbi:cytochrome d ubiquinol oxidase subunit II [Croceimicrobium sp.]|uniref:cytochrome d ubiquinol oxidase subunit II n=1 Tax=Croceimicrobium sp. TaxID=2828340 RepID=UPI003BAAAB5D
METELSYFLGIDYPTWWFLIVGGVFAGYAILDGFDLGAGSIHLFLKKEQSRRIALNAIGPVWDGNEVWLVIAGGALFAGFPVAYASLFSAFYIPFMLFLVLLIFRAIAIEFRSKEDMKWWRNFWDRAYFVASNSLSLLLGVVVGNLMIGLPIDERGNLVGSWLQLLNPYALLMGFTILALFVMHGIIYLLLKTEGRLYAKLRILLNRAVILFIIAFTAASAYGLYAYPKLSDDLQNSLSFWILPSLGILSILSIPQWIKRRKFRIAFVSSALAIALMLGVLAFELYPVLLYSTLDPAYHIDIYSAASSQKSLGIMLLIAAIGTPLILGYTAFVFYTFRGKVRLDENSY